MHVEVVAGQCRFLRHSIVVETRGPMIASVIPQRPFNRMSVINKNYSSHRTKASCSYYSSQAMKLAVNDGRAPLNMDSIQLHKAVYFMRQ